MKAEGKKWFNALKRFIRECREKRPILLRNDLSNEAEIQCRIIGGSLIAWLREHGPRLIQERAVEAELQNFEKDPYIVFTSESPGLVAAREILSKGPANIAFLYPVSSRSGSRKILIQTIAGTFTFGLSSHLLTKIR